MASASTTTLLREVHDELDGAALFRGLAELDRSARRDRVYLRLAEAEERHAASLADELRERGVAVPPFRPSWRTRALLALARRLGTVAVLPRVARLERVDAERYARSSLACPLPAEERANAAELLEFTRFETGEAAKRLLLRLRRTVLLVVGATLFGTALVLARNVQVEGLVFGLAAGVVTGPVLHYLLAKVLVPLPLGRLWCGWACWTAAVLDQLPYRNVPPWLPRPYRRLRAAHLGASVALVLVLALGFGYGGGALGPQAAVWFVVGNALYWTAGIGLAVVSKDNRAFCKYACPVSVILRVTARPALLKVAGDADACATCASRACERVCPMGIRVADYVASGRRVLSTECIGCLACVAVCPPNTLSLRPGFDLGGLELLREPAGGVVPATAGDARPVPMHPRRAG